MEAIEEAILLKKELDLLRPLSPEREKRIMQKFRLDWNYHSNSIEGNSLTYGETKALILFGITAQGKPLNDHIEMRGHNNAVEWIMDIVTGDRPLTENFIRELHTLLLQKPYEVDAVTIDGKPTTKKINVGQYKRLPNHVKTATGEIFYFSSPEETPGMMYDLIEWYRELEANASMIPILLAAEFHYRFIRIHPFDDGNGRTARLLMNFILMKHGFPPVIIKTGDKANYLSALNQADAGIIRAFVDYIAINLVASLSLMIRGAQGEDIEDADDIDKELDFMAKMLDVGSRKVSRSREVLDDLVSNSLIPLVEKMKDVGTKFNRFYENNLIYLTKDQSSIPMEATRNLDMKSQFSMYIDPQKNSSVYIVIRHERFLHPNHVDKSYMMIIKVNTLEWSYLVSSEGTNVNKQYGQQLTEKEINQLVGAARNSHKRFLDGIAEEELKNLN